MQTFLQDLRYGIRVLAKNPGFTGVAVLTLALGIGANTAIFSLISAVLLEPLPYRDPDRLVMLWETKPADGVARRGATPANFADWRRYNSVFEDLAALNYRDHDFTLTGGDRPERVGGGRVSASLFSLLGVRPRLGRIFLPAEDGPGAPNVVLLSYNLWARRYGEDPQILGKAIELNGNNYTVVGVLPPEFHFFDRDNELWTTLGLTEEELSVRGWWFLRVFGRLKPGVTLEQAQAEMNRMAGRLEEEYPQTNAGCGVEVIFLKEWHVAPLRPMLWVLFAAVGVVLLIACANVAGLILARLPARGGEMAVRAALGAGRLQLVRQLLSESSLLGALGACAGLLLGVWGIELLVRWLPTDVVSSLPTLELDQIGLDGRVLIFLALVLTGSVLLFGLLPALAAMRGRLQEQLMGQQRTLSAGRHHQVGRRLLVVSELGLAVVLLAASLLLVRSLLALGRVDLGFDPTNVLTLEVAPEPSSPGFIHVSFYEDVLEKIRALPGVRSAAAALILPATGARWSNYFFIEGGPQPESQMPPLALYRIVSPGYFETLRIPLLKGRIFVPADDGDATGVVIINSALSQKFWPDEDPLGKRLRLSQEGSPWLTIVGVAGNVRYLGLRQEEPEPVIYRPYAQHSMPVMKFLVKAEGDPVQLADTVRSAVWEVDRNQPIYALRTMESVIDQALAQTRFVAYISSAFAALSMVLALIGIYGVTASYLSQRTREIGIRMAVGAAPRDILAQVMAQGLVLTITGTLTGLLAAFAAADFLSSFLFQVHPAEPLNLVVIAVFVMVTGLAATYLAARRAAKVDPMVALRYE